MKTEMPCLLTLHHRLLGVNSLLDLSSYSPYDGSCIQVRCGETQDEYLYIGTSGGKLLQYSAQQRNDLVGGLVCSLAPQRATTGPSTSDAVLCMYQH
jgi:hypothetical protein